MKGNFWFEQDAESALLKNRDVVKKIIKNCGNVVAVFSGHQHWTKNIVEDNISYYIIGSFVENINGDGIPDGIYLEIQTIGNNIEVKENHIRL